MPKVSEVYSGSSLKADVDVPDLEDGGLVLTVNGAEFKEFDDGGKIILQFRETDKSLVLNKTNADTLTKMFGSDDTDDWRGGRIKLYATDTTYGGKPMRGIRVYSKAVKAPAPVRHDPNFDETADDVPPPPPRVQPDDTFEV